MPTLPLFDTTTASSDAAHHVTAPGGYELWHFDAHDPATDTQFVIVFSYGFPFHPGYLRRYLAFRRRPTRISPPSPQEYPCVSFALYRGGRLLAQSTVQYAPNQFEARAMDLTLRIGPNTLARNADGIWQLSLSGALTAELTFHPRLPHAPHERAFLSDRHRWLVSDPLCDVSGVIDTGNRAAAKFQFTGRGYHEHRLGTSQVGQDIHRWMRGRVLLDRRAFTFQLVRAAEGSTPDEVQLIEANETGMRERTIPRIVADWSARAGRRLAYPNGIAFGDLLRLQQPRVVDTSFFSVRLVYEAMLRGEKGTALCEVIYPQRLGWPILGRIIERSITVM